jgi:hypothetical protein
MKNPNQTFPSIPINGTNLSSYSLPELLSLRDKIVDNKHHIRRDYGAKGYSLVLGKIQEWIHYRRTHRKSGLIIPYSKDITTDE